MDTKSEGLSNFKNSPIVQRLLDICVDLDDSLFDQKIPTWLAKVTDDGDYSSQDIRQFWMFRIEESGGIPKPKARLYQIPRILHKAGSKLVKGIEIVPSIEANPSNDPNPPVLRFSQWRHSDKVTRFSDLESEVNKWMPDFCHNFGIEKLGGITLRYVNDIGIEKHPGLWNDGKLNFGQVLSFIPAPQGNFGSYTHSFKIETNQPVDKENKIHFKTVFQTTENSFHLIFEYSSMPLAIEQTIAEVFEEIEKAHALVLNQFQAQFTEQTLQYFQG